MNYIVIQLEKEVSQLEFKAAALREKVTSLWTRLAVPVEEREELNQMYTGSHTKTIKAVSSYYNIRCSVKAAFTLCTIVCVCACV